MSAVMPSASRFQYRKAPVRSTVAEESDFAHSHATVRTFMTQQQNSGDTYNVTNSGGTNQIGSNNTLNITNGFQPDQLAQFAQQVLAAVTMDVPDSLREQITEDAQTLLREAESEEPQPGRVRRFLEGVQESLQQAGQEEAAKQLIQNGTLLLSALAG